MQESIAYTSTAIEAQQSAHLWCCKTCHKPLGRVVDGALLVPAWAESPREAYAVIRAGDLVCNCGAVRTWHFGSGTRFADKIGS